VNGNYPATTNRVFHITSDLVVTISGLTITGGSAPGPAPNNYGAVFITKVGATRLS